MESVEPVEERVPHDEVVIVGEQPVETEAQQYQEQVVEALGALEENGSLGDGSPSRTIPEGHILEDEEAEEPTADTTAGVGYAPEISAISGVTLDEAGITQFLEVGDLEEGNHFETDLQQWLALKEEAVRNMAAQLAEVEARRQTQAQEFAGEIEQLKQQHSGEVQSALAVSAEAQEELKRVESMHREELEHALVESENKHREEMQALRAKLETKANVESGEASSGEQQVSLIPRLSPQLSPRAQRELKLQRERLSRQHQSEFKSQEQKLCSEFTLQSEALQSRLEEEYTAKLAEAVTESALKNAAQVEEISRELRLEKQRALEQVEREGEERRRQEAARLSEERRESVEACKAELESVRAEYTGRILALEEALENQQGEGPTEAKEDREGEEWEEKEEKLRREMEAKYWERVEDIRRECNKDKEAALETLRGALEGGLQTELRRAHELHTQALVEQRAQLTAEFEQKVSTADEIIQTLEAELQRVGEVKVEAAVEQVVKEQEVKMKEMSERLREAHRAELLAEREEERGRHQEEVEKLRETRLHQELEELTQSHKAEVSLLQRQYQSQLDSLSLTHQQTLAQAREAVEKTRSEQSRLEQLQNEHITQLRVVEEEGTQRVAQVHQELERVKEELVEVKVVVEEQRGALRVGEEERGRLSHQVQTATAGEREREEQRDRQHREDTASLAILQKQLGALTNEKEALQSCLVMLQSSVSGCVQLASLVEQTLSSPTSTTTSSAQLWQTPSAQQERRVERSSSAREEGKGEEDTFTPPPPTTTPTPGHTSGAVSVASGASTALWTKSATNFLSSGSLLRQTPSDDSGLASQQTSVANSEATLVVTPMVDDSVETQVSQELSYTSHQPPQPHQPPDLTILPLDDTAVSLLQDASQVPGLSYDQSQLGMLSVSFLDATHHSTHHHPPPPPTPGGALTSSVSAVDHSVTLPLNLSHLPTVQEGLSHLHEVVSSLLQRYITVAAEAADYQHKLVVSTAERNEATLSQESLRQRVSELEREARVREGKLNETLQLATAAQDNLQRVVSESLETRSEAESLKQQLSVAQESLAATQQSQTETETQLGEARERIQAQSQTLESLETQSQLRVQMFDSQIVQLQEELQAAQRNCAGAVHEKEAMHQENKRLAGVQVNLEGQLRRVEVEAEARHRELESQLRGREEEIRELEGVRAEVAAGREAQEVLAAERDELRQRLGSVEHQLALSQAVSSEDQERRIQELSEREAQLTSDLRQQTATVHALQERVRVAQESLNQTTQENLSVRMSVASLEGEVNRLREELQRRETALHSAQAQSAAQTEQLNGALQELAQLRAAGAREEGEGEGEESEEEEHTPSPQESSHEVVSKLQQELVQQQELSRSLENQISLLRDTLTSKDRELEALRLARSHQEQALQETRAQLDGRETPQTEVLAGGKEEGEHRLNSSSAHSLLSSTTSTMLEESGSRSILRRIADLAPVLSQEAHIVNQLSKNNQMPLLSVEQLTAAVNSLSQVVEALSERVGEYGGRGSEDDMVGVLGAVQRLVQELTVVLSSLDQRNATQLPQQLSAVSDLLSQLISSDREALVRDTHSLRDTITSLQTQLQQQSEGVSVQTQRVFEENEQLRIKLRDAEHRLQQETKISAQQRVSLEVETSRNAQLERERLAAVSQLETEVKGLHELLRSVTSDLEEAQSRLAEYQEAEGSLERSAHTISSLHQELRVSKEKEAELENALQELTHSQGQMGQQQSRTHQQQLATLASMQEALELERGTKDEMVAQLCEVQSQLQDSEEARGAEAAERRQLHVRLEEAQRELERGRRAEEVGRQREVELDRVQAILQSLEADNREQGEHYSQLLENERRMVVSLRSSLTAKERELTETVDKFLQEKVALAKAQGELTALRARCETDRQHISSLQSKLSRVRAEGESRGGEESVRQLEVDQLRRQLHQLQANAEKQRGTVSEAVRDKQQLQATVSKLQSEITHLQQKSSNYREEVLRLSEELANKEEEVARLQEQLFTTDSTPSQHSMLPQDLLQAKLMRLYAKYREAEVHRKALVFQKNYLKCQVDAFFQTQQAALIMMAEMGAPPANTHKKPKSRGLRRLKIAVHAVMASLRFQYVVRRKNQYIRSYSNRVEREKSSALTRGGRSDRIRPATGIDAILSSYKPPSLPPMTTRASFPSPTTITPGLTQPKRPTLVPSSTKHVPHTHSTTSTQPTEPPHPSTFIPSLARLQAKLNGAAH